MTILRVDDEQKGVVVVRVLSLVAAIGLACEMRSPRYSMMRVPLRMRRSANTPWPCTLEPAHLDGSWRRSFARLTRLGLRGLSPRVRPPPAP